MSSLKRGHIVLQSCRNQYAVLHTSHKLFSTTSTLQSRPSNNKASTGTVVAPDALEINAPLSTLPADLDLPETLPSYAGAPAKIQRIVALGRAYLTFYKTGLKNVFRNYRASLPLRRELGLPAYFPISPPRKVSNPIPLEGVNGGPAPSRNTYDLRNLALGRGQFQLVRRSARDVRRMIPFTLILIICGEFTPLIVPIIGSSITPATCRVPGQIAKERETASKRKALAVQAWVGADAGVAPKPESDESFELLLELANPAWVVTASPASVLQACAVFGLVKKHDRFAGAALTGLIYRRRLSQYLEYLAIDDAMIRGGGGVKKMSYAEVRIALDERGAVDVGDAIRQRSAKEAESFERDWLSKWLKLREKPQ
ncbi:hypothetical protein N7520_002610 [Penicillium odoratum]|uniref:uncharacterized protein n=1 Tax=Penicillium odoratum TaxID=1167516 RepID=UPI0025480163|nr:uncharacterized protein N7520_002610 [Penicillium odoratum]KAJ5772081.1 hypothetical protein N7520_002610 [Penicillium odoratum]